MGRSMHEISIDTLLSLLKTRGTPIITLGGVRGILQSVLREDGSGLSFIVSLLVDRELKKVYVRVCG